MDLRVRRWKVVADSHVNFSFNADGTFVASRVSTSTSSHDSDVDAPSQDPVSIWLGLPVEVFAVIFEQLGPAIQRDLSITPKKRHRALKVQVSHVSLTCWYWCRSFRHFLFTRLCLQSVADIQTLSAILQSPVSSWLREKITSIFFRNREKGDRIQMPWPLWRMLLRSLPSLAYLRIGGHLRHKRIYAWRDRPLLKGLHSLRSLQFINIFFASSTALIRVLGELPRLESLDLSIVPWLKSERAPAQLVSCSAGFEHIRYTSSFGVPEAWPMAWLFAAASTRHRYTMRVAEDALVPPDILAIVGLSRLCCVETESATIQHVYQRHRVDEGPWL